MGKSLASPTNTTLVGAGNQKAKFLISEVEEGNQRWGNP